MPGPTQHLSRGLLRGVSTWHSAAAVSGASAVALGAYGAHAFKPANPAFADVRACARSQTLYSTIRSSLRIQSSRATGVPSRQRLPSPTQPAAGSGAAGPQAAPGGHARRLRHPALLRELLRRGARGGSRPGSRSALRRLCPHFCMAQPRPALTSLVLPLPPDTLLVTGVLLCMMPGTRCLPPGISASWHQCLLASVHSAKQT